MAGMQNFRSALGGFNRTDVVRYIEYMNNQHRSELEQLNTQLKTAQARCAQLEAQLEGNGVVVEKTSDELEAYRRAERAERLARDRAAQIYAQANATLADATVKVEAASDNLTALAEQVTVQVQDARNKLQEAVASMYAIRPEDE